MEYETCLNCTDSILARGSMRIRTADDHLPELTVAIENVGDLVLKMCTLYHLAGRDYKKRKRTSDHLPELSVAIDYLSDIRSRSSSSLCCP